MGGEDIAEIGAVEDILKGREDSDPYWWPPAAWDKSAGTLR